MINHIKKYQSRYLLLLRFAISSLLIYGIYRFFSNNTFQDEQGASVITTLLDTSNLLYSIPFIIFVGLGLLLAGIRFYYLMNQSISLKDCIRITYIGSGANMLLPARGGDLLKIALVKKKLLKDSQKKKSYLSLFALMIIERYFDFFAILSGAIVSLIILQNSSFSALLSKTLLATIFWSLTLIWLFMLSCLLALPIYKKAFYSFLKKLQISSKNKKSKKKPIGLHTITTLIAISPFKNILQPKWLKQSFEQISFGNKNLLRIIALSFLCWLGPYALSLAMIYQMFNIPLLWPHLVFVQFASVVGLLIPAAPSGIGTVHASIVSAFYITQFSQKQGLVFATGFHILNTLSVLFFAILFAIRSGVRIWNVSR